MKITNLILLPLLLFTNLTNAQLLGGWTDVKDTSSSDFQRVVKFTAAEITIKTDSSHSLRSMEITKAQKKLVAGIHYRFNLKLGETECKASEKKVDIENCKFLDNGKIQSCTVRVLDRPWLDRIKLEDYKCTDI